MIEAVRASFLTSGLIIFLGLFLGRLTGFFRDLSLFSIFGVSEESDIIILALTIPDFFINLLAAGSLGAALVPEFVTRSDKNASHLCFQFSLLLGLVCCLLAIFPFSLSGIILSILAPGLDFGTNQKVASVLNGTLWLIPITLISGVTTAYLHSRERFGTPAFGTLILNTSIIVGLVFFIADKAELERIVYFVLFGGLLRWVVQLFRLRDIFFLTNPVFPVVLEKDFVMRYIGVCISVGLMSTLPVAMRTFASYYGEGGISLISYTWKLVELPVGLVMSIIPIVAFPRLSKYFVEGRVEEFSRLACYCVSGSIYLSMWISLPLVFDAYFFVDMVFGWVGYIDKLHFSEISRLFQYAALSIPSLGFNLICISIFNSQKRVRVNLIGSIICLAVFVLMNILMAPSDDGLLEIVYCSVIALSSTSLFFVLVLIPSVEKIWSFMVVAVVMALLSVGGTVYVALNFIELPIYRLIFYCSGPLIVVMSIIFSIGGPRRLARSIWSSLW